MRGKEKSFLSFILYIPNKSNALLVICEFDLSESNAVNKCFFKKHNKVDRIKLTSIYYCHEPPFIIHLIIQTLYNNHYCNYRKFY